MNIAVLPGDGIGEEVMASALKILEKTGEKFGFEYVTEHALVGGAAIDAVGSPLPDGTLALCKRSDAVLFGSIGGPKWEKLPREQTPEIGGLLRLRQELQLFANIRPARLFPSLVAASPLARVAGGFDFVVVRELLGDAYFGEPKYRDEHEAYDTMRYSKEAVTRIAKVAFDLARTRRKKVTSIDKANVLTVSKFWRDIVTEVGGEYPDVALDHLYVDNAAMQLVLRPQSLDVVLAPNLFGDILSDEAGAITGSIGMLPSASLAVDGPALYEPSGGSAPDIAGKGIANPSAQILCVALMLRMSFGKEEAARAIEMAVEKTVAEGYRTGDIWTEGCTRVGTTEFTERVLERL